MFKLAQSYLENAKVILDSKLKKESVQKIFEDYLKYKRSKQIVAYLKKFPYNGSDIEQTYLKNLT